jgi:hypothetical protein
MKTYLGFFFLIKKKNFAVLRGSMVYIALGIEDANVSALAVHYSVS